MKVKNISIEGMHKVVKKQYDLNDSITYFVGENGAGKSTVLQAIQLALLGYIPGYNKQNETIMRHSPAKAMSVELTLDNGNTIERTWLRDKSSVKSSLSLGTPDSEYDGDADKIIQSWLGSTLLPVFNFNEFRSMTANKLKEWFIEFLPSSTGDLNIADELKASIADRAIDSSELIDEIKVWLDHNSELKGVELIKALNAKFKEDQSFTKGQIAKLQGTIQSLVKYDDADDLGEEEVRKEIATWENRKTILIQYQSSKQLYDRAKCAVEALRQGLDAASYDEDPTIKEINDKISELFKKSEVLKADYQDLASQINELQRQKAMLPKAGSTCPYTNEACETAAKLVEKTKSQIEDIDKQIAFKQEEMNDCSVNVTNAIDREIFQLKASIAEIQSKYDKLAAAEIQLQNANITECPNFQDLDEIDQKIRECQDMLVRIEANKRYNELSDKVTADKFKLETELEIYKVWDKLTSANGLQTQMMDKPFEELAGDMSAYLSKMFGYEVTAKFNLIAKANSFSFGLERGGNYIEFDYLSSGERCLFTLALIMCILNRSKSQIRTILIDDILDHLDTANASYLFDALKQVDDIQFILAGVKECSDESICKSV